jgi:general stress protein 26
MICKNELGIEVWQLFQPKQIIYFATIEGNKPRVRPVTMLCQDDRFWILTGTNDNKVSQLQQNPRIELCLPLENDNSNGYVRISGKAIIVQEESLRRKLAENCDYFHNYWQDTNDPGYTLLEIEFQEIEYLKPGDMEGKKFQV